MVALHPEGVDRNKMDFGRKYSIQVALHPEGVDRNSNKNRKISSRELSPSTRRAWIEIRPRP